MISLNDWVNRYAKLPLIRLVGVALLTQLVYFGYLTYNRYINQLERINQMRESLSLGVQQSNRSLIEATLAAALTDTDVKSAALCAGAAASISYPPSDKNYCKQPAHSIWEWSVRRPLVGLQDLDLLLVFYPLATFGPILFLITVTLVLLLAIIWTMSSVRQRMTDELLAPLYGGLNGKSHLNVVELEELRLRNIEHTRLARKEAASEAMFQLSTQVAHDIRSPLVALDAALENTSALPEKQRTIVRHSLNRIRDVANSLLERNRSRQGIAAANPDTGEQLEVRLLSSLIDPVVAEKRMQYASKPGIDIDFKPTGESYGLFSALQPVEFGRLLSNLVNNAVEAMGDKGKVDVRLTPEDGHVLLSISDNGKGISPEVLAKLGKKGETHGKAGGSGLGLFHARTMAESWGGNLVIDSTPGKGTAVTIKLPKAETPSGFVAALELVPGRPVIVLDDDKGIHSLWQKKLETVGLKENNIEVLYFSEPEGLRAWLKAEPAKAKIALCFFDYELTGQRETGISLAEELGLCPRTIIVSGRSEERQLMEDCARLKVRSIPKNLLEFVPVKTGAPRQAVLIDDDIIVHMNWETAAEEAGIELKSYKDPAEFLSALGSFSNATPVYIDSELGVDAKGEDVAAALKEKGFTNLTLVTGYSPERFAHLSWLKVRGKESPWRA